MSDGPKWGKVTWGSSKAIAAENERAAANLAHAQAFSAKFPSLKVSSINTKGGAAMAAHHNAGTGFGFTATWQDVPNYGIMFKVYLEFTGKPEEMDRVASELRKIVGGK
jgi:hypothetical protein